MECNSCASKSHSPVRHTGTEAHWCFNKPPKPNPWPWELHPRQLRQAIGALPEPVLLSIGFNLCASQLSPHPHWEAKIYPLVEILHLTWSILFSLLLASWNRSNEQSTVFCSQKHRSCLIAARAFLWSCRICASSAASQKVAGNRVGIMRVAISALQRDATVPSPPKPNSPALAMDNNWLFFQQEHALLVMPWHIDGATSSSKQSLQTGPKPLQKSKKIDSKSHARKCWTPSLEQK